MPDVRVLQERPPTRGVLRRAWPLVGRQRWSLGVTAVLNLAGAGASVATLAVIGLATDAVVAGDRARLVVAAVGLGAIALLRMALVGAASYWTVRVGESVVRALRDRAVERIAAAPLRFVETHRSGDLLRRVTGEIAELSSFVGSTLPSLANATLVLLVTAVVLTGYSWELTLALLVAAVPATLIVLRRYLRVSGPAYAAVSVAEAQVSATFAETLPAREQLRSLGARTPWMRRFADDNEALLRARTSEVRVELLLNALSLVQGVAIVLVLALAWRLTVDGALTVGTAVVFALAIRSAFGDVDELVAGVGEAREAQVHLARVLDLVEATQGPARPDADLPTRGDLVARGLSFSYGDHVVLDDVDLVVASGEHVALVGPTGSGKSTLAKMLAGLYSPDSGTVTLGDHDLAQVSPRSTGARLVLVPQDVLLVDGSLADNLRMAPGTHSDADLTAAVSRLGLVDWVASMPEGLETRVGARGARLSAGERQLVALLRTSLLDPAVLVLDEATADVDPATARRVEEAVAATASGRTLVVVAHRPETIAQADRVVTLVDGRITA